MSFLRKVLVGTTVLIGLVDLTIAAPVPAKSKPPLKEITTPSGLNPLKNPDKVLSTNLSAAQRYRKLEADPDYHIFHMHEGDMRRGYRLSLINDIALQRFEEQLGEQNAVGFKYQEEYGKWDPKLKKFANQDKILGNLKSGGDAGVAKAQRLEEAVEYMKNGGEDLVNKLYEMIRLRDYRAWQRAIIVWLRSIFGYSEEAQAMREKAWEQYKADNPDKIPQPAEEAQSKVYPEKDAGIENDTDEEQQEIVDMLKGNFWEDTDGDEKHEAKDPQIKKPDVQKSDVNHGDSKAAEPMHYDEDHKPEKKKSKAERAYGGPEEEGEEDIHAIISDKSSSSKLKDSTVSRSSSSNAGISGQAETKSPVKEQYEQVMKDIGGDPIKYKYPTDEINDLFNAPASASKETLQKYGFNVGTALDAQKLQDASAKLHSILTSLAGYNNNQRKLSEDELKRVDELIDEAEAAGKAEDAHGLIDTEQSIWRMAAGGNPQVLELVEKKFPGAKEFVKELQARKIAAEAKGAADEDAESWLSYKKVDPFEMLRI